MDQHSVSLKQTADHYLLRGLFCEEVGLWNGKMGMSLFFFLLSRHTNNRWYEEFAGELLDDVYAKRQKHCRRVLSSGGVAPCIPAGCGMGGASRRK